MTRKGNNTYGRAGKGAVPAATAAAFFYAHSYEGFAPPPARGVVADTHTRVRRIAGCSIPTAHARAFRRWQQGTTHVSAATLLKVLAYYGLDLPEFHRWCRAEGLPVVD